MWANVAKAIAKFGEGVVTAVDAKGYPISVRVIPLAYDAASGELPVSFPETLGVVAGPANLLCHSHNDKLWNMKMVSVKGRVEARPSNPAKWVFVTTEYVLQSDLAMIGRINRSTRAYLDKRGLPMPQVNFEAVKQLWVRAKQVQNP